LDAGQFAPQRTRQAFAEKRALFVRPDTGPLTIASASPNMALNDTPRSRVSSCRVAETLVKAQLHKALRAFFGNNRLVMFLVSWLGLAGAEVSRGNGERCGVGRAAAAYSSE
jgi:hypothetical protein